MPPSGMRRGEAVEVRRLKTHDLSRTWLHFGFGRADAAVFLRMVCDAFEPRVREDAAPRGTGAESGGPPGSGVRQPREPAQVLRIIHCHSATLRRTTTRAQKGVADV